MWKCREPQGTWRDRAVRTGKTPYGQRVLNDSVTAGKFQRLQSRQTFAMRKQKLNHSPYILAATLMLLHGVAVNESCMPLELS